MFSNKRVDQLITAHNSLFKQVEQLISHNNMLEREVDYLGSRTRTLESRIDDLEREARDSSQFVHEMKDNLTSLQSDVMTLQHNRLVNKRK